MSLWEEGDIAAAVAKAKNQGAVFIVFVKGDNELSVQFEELLSKNDILQKLKCEHFVAIKVQENSVAHQQFSAIYPHSSIPSIFFIGKTGNSIEIITENVQENEFADKIEVILQKAGISTQNGPTTSLINEEKQSSVSPTIDMPSTSAGSSTSPSQPSSDLTPEEKVQHAKELIEQKREDKRRKEEEEERLKELERRKMGQNVQQLKKWQQDEELRQLKEERDKEKRENQAARDRVLAQIAQDKAERAAKFSPHVSSSPPKPTQSAPNVSKSLPKSNVTKLQFRLPNGTLHAREFQISDTLEVVHQYILNEMNLPFSTYTLSTTFPRREFTESDNAQSLLDLQLVPNAVVLILPQNQVATTNPGGMVGNIFWWLLAPLFSIYEYFVGYFFGRPPSTRTVESQTKRPAAPDSDDSRRNLPKRQASESTIIKKQGNIHRLTDRPDSDDDNNTWNGNSTQQM